MIDVGVAIGRFQVDDLHIGHIQYLNYVSNNCKRMVVLLGVPRILTTRKDPLDFNLRRMMIQDKFPNATILGIQDQKNNERWSKNVDSLIRSVTSPWENIFLYGGRDSFIPQYTGKFPTVQIYPSDFNFDSFADGSGSIVRKEIAISPVNHVNFRRGMIYAAYNQIQRHHLTVDIAVVAPCKGCKFKWSILLGTKKGRKDLVIPGGFVDTLDACLEDAAHRELAEETGLDLTDISSLDYVGSFSINDDWRLRRSNETGITVLFVAKAQNSTKVEAGDDLETVMFYPMDDGTLDEIQGHHKILYKAVDHYLKATN